MICPYCQNEADWVSNKVIYGKQYGKSYMVWYCEPCDAYVGCHKNTKRPLGTMANAELRKWRKQAHATIDPLWKNGKMTRSQVYELLDVFFGKEIHVGEADIEMCKQIIKAVPKFGLA